MDYLISLSFQIRNKICIGCYSVWFLKVVSKANSPENMVNTFASEEPKSWKEESGSDPRTTWKATVQPLKTQFPFRVAYLT